MQLLFTGFVSLPDGLIFVMLNRELDCVHKAITSVKNPSEARLMGIEIIAQGYGHPLLEGSFKKEYENQNFSTFSLKLKKGETGRIPSSPNSFFIVCLEGIAKMNIEGSTVQEKHSLKPGEFLLMGSHKSMNIKTQETSDLKMIFIAF